MQSGIFALLGVLVGFSTQYLFRKQDRKWKREEELKRVALEALDIVHELLEFYDTYPQPKNNVDLKNQLRSLNDRVRKSKVKLKVMFYSKDDKLVDAFEEAIRATKKFCFKDVDRLDVSINARQKVKKLDKIVQNLFETSV